MFPVLSENVEACIKGELGGGNYLSASPRLFSLPAAFKREFQHKQRCERGGVSEATTKANSAIGKMQMRESGEAKRI